MNFKKVISIVICAVLAFSVLCMAGCGQAPEAEGTTTAAQQDAQSFKSGSVLGEGATTFKFSVTDVDGEKAEFEIHTDEKTVGEALLKIGMIAGDEGEYGLYVKTVNGTTLDYDKDGKYWAFYVNGGYASTGVDATAIEADTEYSFVVQ